MLNRLYHTLYFALMKRSQSSILLFFVICLGLNTLSAQILINEVCSDNETIILDEFGESSDWLELYNSGDSEVDLSGWFLSDNSSELNKWQFPEVTIATNGYLLIFASGEGAGVQDLHTNFKLSSNGESLSLSNADQELIQKLSFPAIPEDVSYGLSGDEYVFFGTPSPNEENINNDLLEIAQSPTRLELEFFYPSATTISLECGTPNCNIYYSLDGSKPDEDSNFYNGPIQIDTTTSIRAVGIAPGFIDSPIETYTIFISTDHDLPIISLNAEPDDYYSFEEGILVNGPNGEDEFPYFGSNFWSDKEVETNFEFFESGIRQINQTVDTRVHGGTSARTRLQKPLRLLAKEKYGAPFIDYPMFEEREGTQHKRLVLRNASSDFNTSQLRDGLISRYISRNEIHLDELAHRPAALYINGAYYGMINIREKSDEHYIANLYGIDPNNMDLLEEDTLVTVGNFEIFDEMYDFVISNDLSIPANYRQAETFFDVKNIADYFIVQTGLNNNDFGGNNIKYWRERKEGAKWRYILFDLDLALGLRPWSRYDWDLFLEKMIKYEGTNRHINIFQALLENEGFKNYFLNRHGDLFSTFFETEAFQDELDRSVEEIDHEVRKHFERWPSTSYQEWLDINLPVVYTHMERRPAFAYQYLIDFFGLNKTVDLSLNANPQIGGKININSITPDELPWQGTYFDGVPVKLTAVPALGYRFSHWESSRGTLTDNTRSSIEINFAQAEDITAHYVEIDNNTPYIETVWWTGQTLNTRFGILENSEIEFSVYDVLGRELFNSGASSLEPGLYTQEFSIGNAISTGVYFLSLRNGSQEVTSSFFAAN